MAEALPAFEAFQHQLKTLCLKEFPCGTGKWVGNLSVTLTLTVTVTVSLTLL